MHEADPFTTAKEALIEAAGWLSDLLLPEGDPKRETADNESAWEQARSLLSRAVEVLDTQGHEMVEDGGEDFPEHGWVPRFRKDIVDQEAAYAATVVERLVGPLRTQNTASVLPLVTPALIESVSGVMEQRFAERLRSEDEMAAAQSEPQSW